jgi:hypothetical protein
MTMNRRRILIAGSALAIAVAAGGTGLAMAGGGGKDKDAQLTGSDLERATKVALQHTGGGSVIDSEIGDGGAAYSVEIKLADGSVVEVQLDSNFAVTGQEADEDGAGGESGQADE